MISPFSISIVTIGFCAIILPPSYSCGTVWLFSFILLSRIVRKFAKKQLRLACLFSIVSEIRFVFNKIQKNNYFFVFSCDNLKNKSHFLTKISENDEGKWILPHLSEVGISRLYVLINGNTNKDRLHSLQNMKSLQF